MGGRVEWLTVGASLDIKMSLKAIAPLVELVQDEFVQSKVEEAAKLFYSSNTVTINLAAVAAAGLLLLLLLVPLLALLFQPSAAPVSTGYGPPEPSYHSPEPEYGAPADGYDEARSLYNSILDSSEPSMQNLDLSKRLEAVGPVMSALGNAAAKLLE